MEYTYIIFILGFQVILVEAESQSCTKDSLDACWTQMSNLPEHLTWTTIVPSLSEEAMRHHCQVFDKVEACLNTILSTCPLLDNKAHQGIIDAYKWICDDAFDEYLKHRECFTNTNLHKEGTHCNSSLTHRLQKLDPSTSTSYRLQRICQYANDYLDCVENAVKSFCGNDAATWQRKLDTRNIEPLLSIANCKLDKSGHVYYADSSHTKTYIIIGIIAALTVILILLVVIMLVMFKRKKSQMRQHATRNAEHIVVGYTASGDAITSNIQPRSQQQQAGPLPEKLADPPPYEPYPMQGPLSSGDNNVEGATGTAISSPPPYEEDIKKVQPPDELDYAHSNEAATGSEPATYGVDNPIYNNV